jgi:acetylglutamate kinase
VTATPTVRAGHAPVVLKLGGEVVRRTEPVQGARAAIDTLAPDIAELARSGQPIVVVHGGGPQATELQKKLGQTPNIVGGRRVTDSATLDVMKMTVAGLVNVDLCAALFAAGASPVGLHGASSGAIAAVKRPPKVVPGAGPDPVDFGWVGAVMGVNRDLLSLLVSSGFVPVLACLGCDAKGQVYNINADTVANQVAVALDAAALVVVSDVPGVLRDVTDPSSRIQRMTKAEGDAAIADGTVTKGMIPKIEESCAAITAGVRSVIIAGHLGPGDLVRALREPGSVGTVLVP